MTLNSWARLGAALIATWVLWGPAAAAEPVIQQQANNALAPPPLPAVHPIDPANLPAELRPWVDWVTSKHPDLACPVNGHGRACLWPGVLTVDARADGATIRLGVTADREMALVLPGGPGVWPQDVAVGGRSVAVTDIGGHPTTVIPQGRHTITARVPWTQRPASLAIPSSIGRIELTVEGESIAHPRVDGDGLRLGAVASEEREGERLDIEVSRQIRDGVPVVVETRMTLRASGSGREVDLGQVSVPSTRPVSLNADLPARFTDEGTLLVQIRPGTYSIRFEAVHDGPVSTLQRPSPTEFMPPVEYWAVKTDELVRAVNIGGAPGVDPTRTTLPSDWNGLPTFTLEEGAGLTFTELRRGEPEPPPNPLTLNREMWLDLDGKGLTVRDRVTGKLHRNWRMDTLGALELGHVQVNDQDRVITLTPEEARGVELRSHDLTMVAESRMNQRPTQLHAIGWNTDVQQLNATLYLPPGWSLLAASGVDNLSGSVLAQWTLFDLFFVLVLSMATFRLLGWKWGLVALLGLTLGRHESDAPQWTWAILLTLFGLRQVAPEGWLRNTLEAFRALAVLILLLILLPFATQHLHQAFFPALGSPDSSSFHFGAGSALQQDMMQMESAPAEAEVGEGRMRAVDMEDRTAMKVQSKRSIKGKYLTAQVDPSAIVQTGPGVPNWSWEQQPLNWSGPVRAEHTIRLFLLGPNVNLGLAVIRVLLLLGLALALGGWKEARAWADQVMNKPAAAALPLMFFGAWVATPQPAMAGQAAQLRQELESRLTQAPPCAPHCTHVPSASLKVEGDNLIYEAQVHAAADTSLSLPGPTQTWVPRRVTLDGSETTGLARMGDGHLYARIPKGVHKIRLEGPLPPSDAIALDLGNPPKLLAWSGDGWALDGRHADGSVEASVQLARMLGETTVAQSTENLAPWLEVHRFLDLGLPWRVRTEVRRVGPADYPVSVKIPMLPGEALTDGEFEPVDGRVPVTLDRDQRQASWTSTLQDTESIVLTSSEGVPWTEVWTLSCSPIFACKTEGPAPLQHITGGMWQPQWRVWPGEQVTIGVTRPAGVDGQTTTIDQAQLAVTPGRRQLLATLDLRIRSSQGGRQVVTLPEGSELQWVKVNGADRPLRLRDGTQLHIPLQPGSQNVQMSWQQNRPPSVVDRVPAVDLGGSAVNLKVIVTPAEKRWIAWLMGPQWGPVPLFWTYILWVLALAPLLARAPWSPLKTWQWALLGLGMTQVPFIAAMVVALWLLAMGWRKHQALSHPVAFNLAQVSLVGLTGLALLSLYFSIHGGLLWAPDMQVSGNGSWDTELNWYMDRSTGLMPQPIVISFPLWTWRICMLAWSLWLAASLVAWVPWMWAAWSNEGWYRPVSLPSSRKVPSANGETDPSDGADTEVSAIPEDSAPSDEDPGQP